MDKETFYQKLVQSLVQSNFHLKAEDLSLADANTDRDRLSSSVRQAAKLAPHIVGAITGVIIPSMVFPPFFDQEGVQQRMDNVREYADLVFFKYLLAQPVVVAVVEADQLTQEEVIGLAHKFDQDVLEMLQFTGKMGGIKLGGIHLGATRMSATGIILLVFFDHSSASHFTEAVQERCKVMHFWKKTWVVPWTIDVSSKELRRHSGLPVIVRQILNTDRLTEDLFGR